VERCAKATGGDCQLIGFIAYPICMKGFKRSKLYWCKPSNTDGPYTENYSVHIIFHALDRYDVKDIKLIGKVS